jgi:hypothetical protein
MAAHDAQTVRLRGHRVLPAALQSAALQEFPVLLRAQQELRAQRRPAWLHWVVRREPRVVALSVRRRGARSGSEVRRKERSGFEAREQAAFGPRSARGEFRARGVRLGAALLEVVLLQAVHLAWAVRRAVRREPAVQRGARREPFVPVPSAARPAGWLALPAPEEAAWLQAEPDALPRAAGAAAVLPAGLVAAAELRLAARPLAVREPGAVHRPAAPGAAEVQPAAALRELPSAVDLLALPSAAAFHAPSRDRAHPALARSEPETSAHARLRLPIALP